jgi:hypothetical protein
MINEDAPKRGTAGQMSKVFLVWFELPSDLESNPNPPFLSSAERQALLERTLGHDPRWRVLRTTVAQPAGRGETQSFIVFLSADGASTLSLERSLREELKEAVQGIVASAVLLSIIDVTAQWTSRAKNETTD